MPNIPEKICTNININRKDLVDLLLISIALEELSLSHIINAEGEVMELFIKELKCHKQISSYDLIKMNRSVSDTLRIVLEKEKTLKDKLIEVLHFNEDIDCDDHYKHHYYKNEHD